MFRKFKFLKPIIFLNFASSILIIIKKLNKFKLKKKRKTFKDFNLQII